MKSVPGAEFLAALQRESRQADLLPEGVTCQEDLPYATAGGLTLTLDLFDRAEAPRAPRPAIVFYHGGGWQGGNKRQFFGQAAYLAWKRGFLCASVRYRLSHEAPYPAAVQDALRALRFIRGLAAERKVDPEKIAASGGSAGGHLACLVALARGVPAFESEGTSSAAGGHANALVGFNAVCDLEARALTMGSRPNVTKFLGGEYPQFPARYREASPISYVGADAPPALFLHGENDTTVPAQQAREMVQKYRAAGAHAELELYPGQAHGWFNGAPHFWTTLQRMEQFLVERFGL